MAMNTTLVEQFLGEYGTYHGLTPARITDQRRTLHALEQFTGKPLLEVEHGDLAAFLASCVEDGLHPNTVRKYRGLVMPFYGWAKQRRLIDRMRLLDLRDVRPPRTAGEGEPRPYSRAELAQWWVDLAETFPLRPGTYERWRQGRAGWARIYGHTMRWQLQAIVALALYCGMRRNEILYASVNDIHPDNDYVVVRHAARKGGSSHERMREVPLVVGASELMRPWFEFLDLVKPAHDQVWLTLWGNSFDALKPSVMSTLLGKVQGHWELHRFRHTCATEWLRARMPIQDVQSLMGHARIEQTLRYARVARVDVRESAARCGARFDQAVGPGGNDDRLAA